MKVKLQNPRQAFSEMIRDSLVYKEKVHCKIVMKESFPGWRSRVGVGDLEEFFFVALSNLCFQSVVATQPAPATDGFSGVVQK